MTEQAVDQHGNVLWDEPYIFLRLSGPGELLVRNFVEYEVISSQLLPDKKRIETVLRATGKIYR